MSAGLADDVFRAVFGLKIGFGKIFADNTEEEKLDAADEHDDTSEAGPAGDGVAESESFDDNDDNHDEGDKAEEDAEESGKSERNGRESDNTFDGVFEEFPERPLGFASGAFDVLVFDPFCFKADELPEAFRIAVVFGTVDNGVNHLTSHKTVVAGTIDHFNFANRVDEFVENAGAEAANGRLALARNTAGGDAVVALAKVGNHLGEKARRILTVGIHDGDVITSGGLEAGEHGRFFAEIARKGEVLKAGVGLVEGFELR